MNTRKLGRTGYEVSEIGLGTWQLGESFGPVSDESANEILKAARSLDVNFWDTADVYGGTKSEEYLGKPLAGARDEVVIATKFGAMSGANPDTVRESYSPLTSSSVNWCRVPWPSFQ